MTRTIALAPFVDTSPADLTFTTESPLLPALAVKAIGALEMRILGASHQIRIGQWIETLACLPDDRPSLPTTASEPGYTFRSVTTAYAPTELARTVQTITAEAEAAHGLTVTFQGDPLALTCITAEEHADHHEWTTWHVYPQSGEIVTTQSTKEKE